MTIANLATNPSADSPVGESAQQFEKSGCFTSHMFLIVNIKVILAGLLVAIVTFRSTCEHLDTIGDFHVSFLDLFQMG